MKIKVGEWLSMSPADRYQAIKRAYERTQLRNKKAAS